MKKKLTKAAKNKLTKPKTLKSRVTFPKNHGEWLELCIFYTERAMKDYDIKDTMRNQRNRLLEELNKWKESSK